ncbi:MAG: hypothetical protein ACPG7F_10320 [Aggregatilineales bacterium]
MTDNIDYMTIVEPVLEVTLRGFARADLWQQHFHENDLKTQITGQTVEVLISGVSAKYMGIPFRELSVSVQMSEKTYFLAHAYNSLRPFAFAERRFFRTPYYPAALEIIPHRLTVEKAGQSVFNASLSTDATPVNQAPGLDVLQIYLPKNLRKQAQQPHYFHARLEGETVFYDHSTATLNYPQPHQESIFSLLSQSDFQIEQWWVRETARHSKSKTITA